MGISENEKNLNRRLFLERLMGGAVGGAAMAGGLACGDKGEKSEKAVETVKAEKGEKRPPNILLINADDLGMGDLSCYGGEIPTPNIDSIGRQGVQFTDFYVSAPACTPSRFSQMTGLVPGRSRHELISPLMPTRDKDSERGIETGETTTAEVLKKAGYATGLIGKWHLGHGNSRFLPNSHGFDYFYGFTPGCIDFFTKRYRSERCFYRNGEMIEEEEGYSTDLFTHEAVSFLERNSDKPFYLNLAHNAPHYGKADAPGKAANVLQAPEELIARFKGPDRDRNVYSAMVASMDNGVGEVLAALDRLGMAENTIVIFTSDNGGDPDYGGRNGPYRGEKGQLFEGGIRIPCLMRWPGMIPAGVKSSQAGSHLDFFATFAALAGLDVDRSSLDGMDISRAILDPSAPPLPRTLYWDYGGDRAVRDLGWKYLKTAGGEEYLFNLNADPFEKTNLIREHRGQAAELARKLARFFDFV
ncbi:MAG: sulfatase-like hydrolase/transferase [Gemmatimonadota bacterium]|nr:sulfatase-like hydrolase/transferase [Gemmatimonadota bacterium]